MAKSNGHKLCQFIILKYIKNNINWPREVKIAKRLIIKFKSFNFWKNLEEFKITLPSLAWFLKPEGKAFLLKEYEKFNLNINNIKNDNNIFKFKIGNDKKICKKPKTLVEFIRYGKKT